MDGDDEIRRPPGRDVLTGPYVLSVADIVAIDALQVTLRGGHSGSDRPVRWVHISELQDPTPWLRGGELLLTTGLPLRSGPSAYVGRLAAAGPAGNDVPIIYGGSVGPDEGSALLGQPDVDGLFVGRQALDPRVFAAIAHTPVQR